MDTTTPIAEQNTARLIEAACQPEPMASEFAAQVAARMLAQAKTLAPRQTTPRPERPWRRVALVVSGLAACALLLWAYAALRRLDPQIVNNPAKKSIDVDAPRPSAQFADWRNDDALVPRKRPEAPALATLKPGETLTTKPAQRRLVQLADGSRLYVNESTEVEATGPRQLTLHKGQIYVEVEPKGDGPRFVVKSGNRAITATGTHFAVSALDVVVTQGKVAISGVAEQIAAGQQIDLATSRIVPAPRASHTLAWTRELMAAAESPMVPGTQHGGGALIALDPNGQEIKLALRKYYIDVHIEDGFARTTIDQTYFNTTWERLEGTFYFPLPAAASLSRLAMYVVDGNQCKLMEGGMAERKHAADVYETIRYQRRDPALLEWLDGSTFKMRVFPLEAKQEKRIILSYTQKLSSLYGTSRYRFTGGLNMPVVREWSFHARIKNGSEMKVASPSTDHVQILPDAPDMVVKHFGENVKPEADVTIEMKETRPIDRDEPRFTSFLHEGQQYLMLRYRPTLKSEAKRERRDWIVLFETSAGRDPLVAGTQIDVLRHIMNNVEHDDTFTVLTVNSRVGEPSRVSGRVMDAASSGPLRGSARQLELLQQAHLVGALDLQQGLAAAVKLARDAKNPHLLHLGSGIPAMGERDAGKLAKLLPTSVRYVGVGVGKRWNRAFMKAAAERTNGLFTQINPDEPTKWRAFDLLATLNTPRLLDVQVVDAAGKAPFLMETTMIAQGEEVCALTRVDTAKSVAPGSVVVKGTLDGQAFTKEFPVLNVLAGGGYLPRTWAKLEIDRMLAAGSAKHKDAIIALSKAMYVMSPYTSLLVLETDADYERFKVDKGRKDHWAMYPAPAKIPLVYEPAGKPPVKVEVKKGAKPTCEEVLGTIVNALYIPDGGTVWFGGLAFIDPAAIEFDTDIQFNNKRIEDISVPGAVNPNEAIGILGGDITLRPFNIPAPRGFGSRGMGGALEKLPQLATWKALSKVRKEKYNPQREVLEGLDHLLRDGETLRATEQRLRKMREIDPDNVAVLAALHIAANKQAQAQHDRTTHANERVFLQLLDPNLGEYLDMQKPITFSRGTQTTDEWRRFWMNDQPSHLTPYRIHGGVGPASSALSGETINWTEYYRRHGYQINGTQNGAARIQFAPVFVSPQMQWAVPNGNGLISGLTYSGSLTPDLNIPIRNSSFNYSSANFLYQRPQLNYDRTFFTNLVQYAPGLQNTYADILATLEAEADVEQPKLGTIDADARKLIERARAAGWQSLTVPAEGPLAGYSIHYSGSGQFTYERMLVSGLREHVVCDGTTLWHLYPEIGLGAKRPFSRHHHALAASINPAFLPAPEELARGFDVKLVDANTVAIMPLNPLTPGPSPPEYRGRGEEYASLHLVFAADGNLRERRIVAMPKGKTLLRQIFHQDGSIEWKNADDKALATQTRTVAPAKAPDLTPNVRELVVAHMPIRTWQHIFAQADKVSPETKYAPKIVEQWFIAECMDSSRDNLHRLRTFVQFFHAKGDRRLGFYTLINAAEIYIDNRHLTAPDGKTYSINVEKEHPNSPLAMFLAHSQRELASDTSPAKELPGPKDGFIQRMARFRNIWLAWHNQKVTADAMPTELAKVHAHLEDTPSPLFAYAVLDAMERRGNKAPSAHMTDIALKRFGPISDPLGLGYVFRYEHARALWQAGRAPEAIKLLKDLHADTLKLGVLPPIDAAFRETLQLGDVKFIPFARQTLDDLLSKKRYGLAFQLARQMEQLGDVALADEFVNTVLAKSPDEHRPTLTLVGIQHFTHRRDFAQADRLLGKLLEDKKLSGLAGLWRWRAGIARSYNQSAASLSYLEKALDLEYRELPELVDLESFRAEYRGLLEQYQKVAEAHVMLEKSAPKAFLAKVIRTADRWRRIDADNSEPSRSAGKIFHTLGERELAWDYWTAPIDLHPAESAPWLELAQTLQNEGDLDRADQAFAFAFEAETSNPEILWQRAMNLVRMDRPDRARQIYRQIATGQWQERFAATVERARGLAER